MALLVDPWVLVVPGCPLYVMSALKEAWPVFPNLQTPHFTDESTEARREEVTCLVTRLVRS